MTTRKTRRCILATLLFLSCASSEVRCNPTPSCSYDPTAPEAELSPLDEACADARCIGYELSAGAEHACTMAGPSWLCWGHDTAGQLGTQVETRGGTAVGRAFAEQLSAGAFMTCGVIASRVVCWGAGYEQPGLPALFNGGRKIDGMGDVVELDVGGRQVCAIDFEGNVACAGDNRHGQAGGDGDAHDIGQRVEGVRNATRIGAGGMHTCALDQDENLFCWGDNRFGAVGPNGAMTQRTAVAVPLPGAVYDFALGAHHTCAYVGPRYEESPPDRPIGELDPTPDFPDLYCWGRGLAGELGNGASMSTPEPQRVGIGSSSEDPATGLGGLTFVSRIQAGGVPYRLDDGRVVEIEEGVDGFTLVTQNGGVTRSDDTWQGPGLSAFGVNDHGQLGIPPSDPVLVPMRVREKEYDAIATGHDFSCLLGSDGALECFGANDHGQLGLERPEDPRSLYTLLSIWVVDGLDPQPGPRPRTDGVPPPDAPPDS